MWTCRHRRESPVSGRMCLIPMCIIVLGALLPNMVQAQANGKTDYERLGDFERTTLDPILKELGRVVEPKPGGKSVHSVLVHNLDVFSSESDQWLAWANNLHRVTAKDIIAREVLLKPGDTWSQALVDESVRRIRDPFLSNVVIIVPLVRSESGLIDLLVVTRDVWSLRINTDFEAQGSNLLSLDVSLAENNFLGWRKKLAYGFAMNQGQISTGPRYTDPNVAGTRLTISAQAAALFSRADGGFEGTSSDIAVAYPLWRLASRWGGSIRWRHYQGPVRAFQGNNLLTYDVPQTTEVEQVPWEYDYALYQGTVQAFHQSGSFLKQQVRFGVDVYTTTASAPEGLDYEPAVVDAFEQRVLPRRETSSSLFLEWRLFTPEWSTYRNLATFDLREDYRVGPEFLWRINQALRILGSDRDYTTFRLLLSYALNPGLSSYLKLQLEWLGRLQDKSLLDQRLRARLYVVSPILWDAFRLVARGALSGQVNESANRFLAAGGDTALRGYDVSVFRGQVLALANLELRTVPVALWFLRVGGVLFWDAGHAATKLTDLDMHHSVGFGVRLLIPQVNPYVIRVDWAFPVGSRFSSWPGRVSFGFQQAF